MGKVHHPQEPKDHGQAQTEHGVKTAIDQSEQQLAQDHRDGKTKELSHISFGAVLNFTYFEGKGLFLFH
jgi:hypothetical protein